MILGTNLLASSRFLIPKYPKYSRIGITASHHLNEKYSPN